jgi:polyvinyl alcohol dehydrogenase (cytochrome)
VQQFGPAGGAIWSAPSIDAATNTIYATTGDSYSRPAQDTSDAFVAFDSTTGRLKWSRQMTGGDSFNIACTSQYRANCPDKNGPDFDFGSSAILVDLADGKRALIAGQKSGMVHALDPDHDGAILWQRRVGQGSTLGGVQWGMAVDDENVYVAVSDIGLERVAPGTPGAQRTIRGGELRMDPRQGGGLFALKLSTGEIVGHTPHPGCNDKPGCSPAQSAAPAIGPSLTRGELLTACAATLASSCEVPWVDRAFLEQQDVRRWTGPRSLPLGLPLPDFAGFATRDTAPACAAGLTPRPLARRRVTPFDWLRESDGPVTGLTADEEKDVLAAWHARTRGGGQGRLAG